MPASHSYRILVGRRLADEEKMPACRPRRLADRLTGVEIVAEIDRIEPRITGAVRFEPPPRGATFAILLLTPVLWCDELRRQRYDAVMAWSHYGGRQKA